MRRHGSSKVAAAAPIRIAMTVAVAGLGLTLAPPASAAPPPALELRDGGRAALSLENANPGDAATACMLLRYRGAATARVRLYGATIGTGFDRYLDLTVTRGTRCQGFRANATVYDGTLEGFPDGPDSAIEETWSPGEVHAYRFEVSVRDDNAAQGLSATQTFTWAADGRVAGAPSEEDSAVVDSQGGFVPGPSAGGIGELLRRIAEVAAEVGKRSAFPGALLLMVFGFLAVQNRIDRKDPKLALAPVYPTPDLAFGLPPAGGGAE